MNVLEENGIQDKVLLDIMGNQLSYSTSEYDRKVPSLDRDLLFGALIPDNGTEP